jgi:hypothetical protein
VVTFIRGFRIGRTEKKQQVPSLTNPFETARASALRKSALEAAGAGLRLDLVRERAAN